ncbi:metallophosphoesterase [Pendulispora brunnea]|uniref:Metallophosphoesterase n=1 Tax=Pendulispora brunnea TaxID=2905690 RepID=A0ABZ2KF51_9BACT
MKSYASLLVLSLIASACSSSDDNGPSSPPPDDHKPTEREVAKLAPLSAPVKLTDVQTIVPRHAVEAEQSKPTSIEPAVLKQQLADGFGAFTTGPGEAIQVETPDGAAAPTPGPNARKLTRFAHLADFQLADDESPTRVANVDGITPDLSAAWRPQEGHECRVVNAVVRTVNRIHKDAPFDFVVLGGDNADSAQQNEVDWVLALLGGADKLACDSGNADDPVPGANNDGKDPFTPEGLDMPWYWVSGNHDVLIQGTLVVDANSIAQSKGSKPGVYGTRDYRLPGSPIASDGEIPADPNRAAMPRADLIDRVLAHKGKSGPLAHGLGDYAKSAKKAFYEQDLGESGIRLITIDTAAETGGAEGLLRKGDIDAFVKPALERAKQDKKMVLFASHHAAENLSDGGSLGGKQQPDAFLRPEWEALLTANPHVIGHIAGHSHIHKVRHVAAAAPATNGYWEVRTSAIADYPHQFRTIEVWDEDNGYLSIRSVAVDYSTENDSVAEMGRTLGILDYTTHGVGAGQGTAKDRNVILWIKKPTF